MRIPRLHRFRTRETAGDLFRKLPPGDRFRLPAAAHRPEVFGAGAVRGFTLRPGDDPDAWRSALRSALPRLPDVRAEEFRGGVLGWLAYEAGAAFEGMPRRVPAAGDPPDAEFAVYDTVAVLRGDEVEIVSWGLDREGLPDGRRALRRAEAMEERLRGPRAEGNPRAESPPPVGAPGGETVSLDEAGHAAAVGELLHAIRRGDIYQGNLTARFDVALAGDGVDVFERLVRDNPAPHAAFLETPSGTVLSSSPERMLRVDGRRVLSRPIKGTARRSADPEEDRALARALAASDKDRAELLMITDLVRNDLGKVCRFGSIRVPELRVLESFPHLHHLVSTVAGELAPGRDALDALAALFPYGSVTGAPKRRAIEILRDLEPRPRGVYTGSVGWIGLDGRADFNVAIRTGLLRDGVFSFGAGGGIVADSRARDEWQELLVKARGLRLALGLPPGGGAETGRFSPAAAGRA